MRTSKGNRRVQQARSMLEQRSTLSCSEVITRSRTYNRPIQNKYNVVTASSGRTAEVVRVTKKEISRLQ